MLTLTLPSSFDITPVVRKERGKIQPYPTPVISAETAGLTFAAFVGNPGDFVGETLRLIKTIDPVVERMLKGLIKL